MTATEPEPGACSECGKPLTDPVSKKLGIGPKCWLRKYGPHNANRAPHVVHLTVDHHPVDPNQIPLPLEAPMAEPTSMTEQQLHDYATEIILDHARDVETLSIYEMYEEWADVDGAEISDDDAKKVRKLITDATVTVSWPTR